MDNLSNLLKCDCLDRKANIFTKKSHSIYVDCNFDYDLLFIESYFFFSFVRFLFIFVANDASIEPFLTLIYYIKGSLFVNMQHIANELFDNIWHIHKHITHNVDTKAKEWKFKWNLFQNNTHSNPWFIMIIINHKWP